MTAKQILFFLAVLLGLYSLSYASCVNCDVIVNITKDGQNLHADLSGMFMHSGAVFMTAYGSSQFPVPPDANNIRIIESGPVSWSWSANKYITLYLAEEPNWPMIKWDLVWFPGPQAPITITYYIEYSHTLIKRPGRHVFFYANESFEDYDDFQFPHGLFSAENFTIDFPQAYTIEGVWSRDIPLEYQINGNRLQFSVVQNVDRIKIILREPCEYLLAGDLDSDCDVDFRDVAIMANNWLINCFIEPSNPACVPRP